MPIVKISLAQKHLLPGSITAQIAEFNALINDTPSLAKRQSDASAIENDLVGTISINNVLIGYNEVQVTPQHARLSRIVIHPKNQRKGIGTLLLVNTLNQLGKKGIDCIHLHCTSSTSSFFKRFGFSDVSQHLRLHDEDKITMEQPCLQYFLSQIPESAASQGLEKSNTFHINDDTETYYFRNEDQFLALHKSMLMQARKRIWILCDTINNPLLNSDATSQSFLRLVKHNPHAEIKLLIANDKLGAGYFNPSINLAQRLSSYIQVRTLNKTGLRINEMITLVDHSASIYRKSIKDHNGFACFHNRLLAERMRSNFDHHWQFAKQSQELRRLAI